MFSSHFSRAFFTAAVLFAAATIVTPAANAFPLTSKNGLSHPAFDLTAAFPEGYDFEGILALNNCSGNLVRFENSKDTDKAMALTNGHCFEGGFINQGEFVSDVASARSFRIFNSKIQPVGTVNAERLIYATMTNTDISLYRLKVTYKEILEKYNVRPLTLSSVHPTIGDKLNILSGYWRLGYECAIDFFAHELHEDGWIFKDSVRYTQDGCKTIGGTSGSPILLEGTRTQIAINNTGNESGESCTLNNPCEVDEKGNKYYQQGLSYGQQTYWIYSCLDADNKFDLGVKGCLLPH